MSGKRVRVRPLRGGDLASTKNELCSAIYQEGVKFSRIIPTGDTHVVVCLGEDDVNKMIANETINKLRQKQFEIIVPPHLKAKKTIMVKRIDRDMTALPVEVLKADLEERNEWAIIEEVIKFPTMPNMLKIRFTDIKMARKATEQGISLGEYHLSPANVEMEDFIQLTPCWNCYKYDHNVRECPDKNVKKCSECAATGHTFRECREKTNYKCLNCDGNHRTLAAVCPIRKEKIKELREQKKASKQQFETANKTYCAVTKLSRDLPKLKVPEQPVLALNSDMSFKAMVILIHAHLANIANPGCFGTTVKKLLKINNLPNVNLPDDAPSAEIFRMATNIPGENVKIYTEDQDNESDSEEEVEVCVEEMEETEGAVGYGPPTPALPQQTQRAQAPPPPPPSPSRSTRPRKTTEKLSRSNLGLELFSSSSDNIPEQITPQELTLAIKQGRVKYTYIAEIMPEAAVLRYFAEGKLTTQKYPIQRINRTAYKKIRNGIQRSPGDQERYKQRATQQQ